MVFKTTLIITYHLYFEISVMIRIFVWDFYKQFELTTITMKILNYCKYLSVFTLLFGPLSFAQHQFEVKDASKNYDIIISVDIGLNTECLKLNNTKKAKKSR
ncbi:hypothetical protein CW752_11250 [Chryseobacterium sp. PMSZPI]|nr:hypothetical protein CW752_11250 [Chryseobacterium sp. PMSZPI]